MNRLAPTLVLLLPVFAAACPPWERANRPGPIVNYQWTCRSPGTGWCGYPPVRVSQVVESRPETVKDGAPDGWCHVKGRIIWDKAAGPIPVRTPIEANKDKDVAAMDG